MQESAVQVAVAIDPKPLVSLRKEGELGQDRHPFRDRLYPSDVAALQAADLPPGDGHTPDGGVQCDAAP